MTPMIDVVFQLIIFFLVSSHLSRQDTDVKLPLPVADTGLSEQLNETTLLVVHVQQDGSLASGGQPIPASELDKFLAQRQAESPHALQLRLRCHRRVAYQHVQPLLVAAARQGIWNVEFAVYAPDDAWE
jgi:biopolymer transport protein ExbD